MHVNYTKQEEVQNLSTINIASVDPKDELDASESSCTSQSFELQFTS